MHATGLYQRPISLSELLTTLSIAEIIQRRWYMNELHRAPVQWYTKTAKPKYSQINLWCVMYMRSALFWDITQRRLVILYQRFGTTYRSHLQGQEVQKDNFLDFLTFEGCPETSLQNYQSTLRNIPQERRSQCHFIHHRSHMDCLGQPGFCGEWPATNRLSHGTAPET